MITTIRISTSRYIVIANNRVERDWFLHAQPQFYVEVRNGSLVWASVPPYYLDCSQAGRLPGCLFEYEQPEAQCTRNRTGGNKCCINVNIIFHPLPYSRISVWQMPKWNLLWSDIYCLHRVSPLAHSPNSSHWWAITIIIAPDLYDLAANTSLTPSVLAFAVACALVMIFNIGIPSELRGFLFYIQVVGFVYDSGTLWVSNK